MSVCVVEFEVADCFKKVGHPGSMSMYNMYAISFFNILPVSLILLVGLFLLGMLGLRQQRPQIRLQLSEPLYVQLAQLLLAAGRGDDTNVGSHN